MIRKKKEGYRGDSTSKPAYPQLELDMHILLNPSKVRFRKLDKDGEGYEEEQGPFIRDGWTYLCLSDDEKFFMEDDDSLHRWSLVKDNWVFKDNYIMCEGERIGQLHYWNHSEKVKELFGWEWILNGRDYEKV